MKNIRQDFIYPEINENHRLYGGSFLLNPVVKEDGDWRNSLTPYELQRRFNVEPSSCFIETQQHCIGSIEELMGEPDNNYSARFNALLAGGTELGGDPVKGGDSIRHDGLVDESSMPHTSDLKTWEDFHSWKGVDEGKVRAEGQEDLTKKDRRFGVLVEKHFDLDTKYALLEQGLKRSPIPISVWGVTNNEGNYILKTKGVNDTHMVIATYLDVKNKIIHIKDTYEPFEKTLPPNYNFDFAIGWTVKKLEPTRNLYISAGHYGASSGAVVGKLQEAELNKKFLDVIDFGIKVPAGTLRSKIDWVNERANENDIAIEIHCNYSSNLLKRGIEVYYRDEDDKELALKLDEAMYRHFGKTLGGFQIDLHPLGCDSALGTVHHDSQSYVQSLGWCRELKCPAVILEVEYMTNKEGLDVLLDPETPKKVALAIKEVFDPVKPHQEPQEAPQEVLSEEVKESLSWLKLLLKRLLKWLSVD